jgi:hypothetical protein
MSAATFFRSGASAERRQFFPNGSSEESRKLFNGGVKYRSLKFRWRRSVETPLRSRNSLKKLRARAFTTGS